MRRRRNVTGTVKLKLYKGNIIPAGISSPYSLYSEAFATFGKDEVYNQKDAVGLQSTSSATPQGAGGPEKEEVWKTLRPGARRRGGHTVRTGGPHGRSCAPHARGKERWKRWQKLWSGRLKSGLDAAAEDFNASIRVDARMVREDIEGSAAHAAMLAACGVLSPEDAAHDSERRSGRFSADLEAGALTVDPAAEDVHTFVEQTLTLRIGEAGKRLHTARSRNDQVATIPDCTCAAGSRK
jgi:hypothetical protein